MLGMGRHTSRLVPYQHCLHETATDARGRKPLYQRGENILITIVTATAVIEGQLTLGMMLSIQYIIGQLNVPIEQLMRFIYSWQDVRLSIERINEVHLKENENTHRKVIDFHCSREDILLKNVTFSYNGSHSLKVLEDICLRIPNGKVTAIVGASGSGKPRC